LTTIERNALVYYSPDEMFHLVNNVGDYSDFLPWCRSSKVVSESDSEMEASVEIAKGVLNKTFTTRNKLTQGHRIDIALVDGPFRALSGYWQFDALKTENACKVNLVLEFEFDNAMISIAARPVFTQIANSLVEAFCKRAVEVYGERG